ncbi:MAG: VWA domain-containing protein [Planctomycetes bacterium]|nr:VWA domain-containing protein [Planctomycetota bacterium]
MPFPSSNPNQDGTSKALPERDAVAMKNFTFDASAAEATKRKGKNQETSRRLVDTATLLSAESSHEKGALNRAQASPLHIVIKPNEKVRRGMPSWLLSLLLHVLLFLPLGFFGLATSQERQDHLDWTPSPIVVEEIERIVDIEIDPLETIESLDESDMPDWDDLSAESDLANVSGEFAPISEGLDSNGLDDLGMLLGDGNGLSSLDEGPGPAATAKFFGTQVEGKRILYILDNSGGMKKGKFETLVAELLKSVDSLQPRQQFYVIFYSDTVYPLFYPQSATNFVRATKENKEFLREWLDTVELCLGNSIDEAITAANLIRPDVVFLLTDGRLFTTDAKEKILLDGANRDFPINTFGMGVKENSNPAMELQLVAEANRGIYREIQVSPEARAIAKVRLRPYHRVRPGAIWGLTITK